MYLGLNESEQLAVVSRDLRAQHPTIDYWVAPSSIALARVAERLQGTGVEVGSQNVSWGGAGALTGESTAAQLKEAGAAFAIVGHSERRHQCGESIELCVKRAVSALQQGFRIIFCVGETKPERQAGRTESVIAAQLTPLLQELSGDHREHLIVAYEPVWAIGTGDAASPGQADQAHRFIQNLIGAPQVPVLYGGSVTADNIAEYLKLDAVFGALVGGASVHKDKLAALLKAASTSV